jgi:hypothetical protein
VLALFFVDFGGSVPASVSSFACLVDLLGFSGCGQRFAERLLAYAFFTGREVFVQRFQ